MTTTDPMPPIPFGSDDWHTLMRRVWRNTFSEATCPQCGAAFTRTVHYQVYCSKSCQRAADLAAVRAGRRISAAERHALGWKGTRHD